ncbi:EGF-like domain-containing protein [Aphelenchoides bicaudatus]|nr:EGF-like domain-containing protein [Aphelenchoides bicaudatus]
MPPMNEFSVKTLNEVISAGVSSKLIYEGSICESYPCWNEGSCVESNRSIHGYICFCNHAFSGQHCDVKSSNNCSNVFCNLGSFCSPFEGKCIENEKYDLTTLCSEMNPCLNSGICVMLDDRYQCLCPPHTKGLLCEIPILSRVDIPMTWNAFQFLFLFALIFLLLSAFLTFCYAGNNCYIYWPRKTRYSKWNDGNNEDLDWDEEDEDLIGGQHLYRKGGQQRAATTDTSAVPMRLSNTADTFVTYNDSPTNSISSANPSISLLENRR